MDNKIEELINKQINLEFFSSYLYLSFGNYYADVNLSGFENWFNVQAKEELDHAMLFIKYLHNNGKKVKLENIAKPEHDIDNHIKPLKLSYEHEKSVTNSIDNIYSCALENKDFRTTQLLDWFIQEQGEEEKTASEMLAKMELFGTDSKGLYLLNNEFSSRKYVAPSLML